MKRFFITGIGTNVGKTFVSAILTEALKADYWKPVQSGASEGRDVETVQGLITNKTSKFHKEAYLLQEPLSPHYAAIKENTEIKIPNIDFPSSSNTLIIEGAGGLLVPLNKTDYIIDLAKKFDAEVILVVNNYLGCINHTLLSIDYLITHNYKIAGLVLNGDFDREVEEAITGYKSIKVLARIPAVAKVNKDTVQKLAGLIDIQLLK
jgi:dethiobiotin synthetase